MCHQPRALCHGHNFRMHTIPLLGNLNGWILRSREEDRVKMEALSAHRRRDPFKLGLYVCILAHYAIFYKNKKIKSGKAITFNSSSSSAAFLSNALLS